MISDLLNYNYSFTGSHVEKRSTIYSYFDIFALAPPLIALESCSMSQTDRPV